MLFRSIEQINSLESKEHLSKIKIQRVYEFYSDDFDDYQDYDSFKLYGYEKGNVFLANKKKLYIIVDINGGFIMKVWQLEKIMELVREEDIEISEYDYEIFLSISKEDINYLIQKMEENNKKVKQLFRFLIHINKFESWDDNFSHLEEIENFNAKEYILNKIATASSQKHAQAIYCYYKSKLSVLQTVEEFKTYIEAINPNIFKCNNDIKTLNNLEFILKNNSEEDRCNLIKKVMQYYQSGNTNLLELSECSNTLKNMPDKMNDLFDLLLKGYDFYDISKLLVHWTNNQISAKWNHGDVNRVNAMYREVLDYLKTSTVLININPKNFVRMIELLDIEYFSKYIKLLKELEEKKEWKLLGICTSDQVRVDGLGMLHYLEMKVLCNSEQPINHFTNLRDKFISLLTEDLSTILLIPGDTYQTNEEYQKIPVKITVLEYLDSYNVDDKVLEDYSREKVVENFKGEDEVTSDILSHFLIKKYR